MKRDYEKSVAIILFILLIAGIVPICIVGAYNHPTGDDFYYGAAAHNAFINGGFFFAVREAVKGVAYEYNAWQGTYSALFLFYLAPNVFSENAYHFVTTLILVMLIGGIFYLFYALIVGALKDKKSFWVIASSLIAIICIQTVPSQGETFFWYNGSIYYTGFLAITFLFFGMLINLFRRKKWWLIAGTMVLSVILAGGNYVTLLPCMIITLLISRYGLYIKKDKIAGFTALADFLLQAAFFAVSALAPGNKIRAAQMDSIPAWKAVIKSLLQGLLYAKAWIRLPWLLGLLILLPFFLASYKRVAFKFRYPFLVAAFIYGLFCSMSCPTFYSMNSTGPARAVAVVYYMFVISSYAMIYYLFGALYVHSLKKGTDVINSKAKLAYVIAFGLCVGAFAFLADMPSFSLVKSIKLLSSGQAAAFEEEYEERLEILNDDSVINAVLPGFETRPDMLYVGDISDDADSSANVGMAEFYGKESVIAKY